jgi:hypothetical protein
MLNATIQARSDVDRVTVNNSVVIPAGTLPDGNMVQFDSSTLDLMDRVHAIFLSGTFGNAIAQARQASLRRRHKHEVLHAKSQTGATQIFRRARRKPNQKGSGSQNFADLITGLESINTAVDTGEFLRNSQNAQSVTDEVQAIGQGIGVVNTLLADDTNFGMISAVMSTVNTTVHCWGDVGQWVYAEATGDQQGAAQAVQDMEAIPLSEELMAIQNLALAPFTEIEAVSNGSTILNFLENAYQYLAPNSGGSSDASDDAQTQDTLVTMDSGVFASSSQGIGEVTGSVTIDSNLGLQAPQTGMELSPGPENDTITDLADPSGNYDMYVPLGDSGFDYSNSDFSAFDPVSGNVLASEVVDLSMATTTTPVMIAPLQGTCSDDDIDNPDQDDPDCD